MNSRVYGAYRRRFGTYGRRRTRYDQRQDARIRALEAVVMTKKVYPAFRKLQLQPLPDISYATGVWCLNNIPIEGNIPEYGRETDSIEMIGVDLRLTFSTVDGVTVDSTRTRVGVAVILVPDQAILTIAGQTAGPGKQLVFGTPSFGDPPQPSFNPYGHYTEEWLNQEFAGSLFKVLWRTSFNVGPAYTTTGETLGIEGGWEYQKDGRSVKHLNKFISLKGLQTEWESYNDELRQNDIPDRNAVFMYVWTDDVPGFDQPNVVMEGAKRTWYIETQD